MAQALSPHPSQKGCLEPSPNSCKWKAICTHFQDESFCFNRSSFCWHCHCHSCLLCLLAICWQDTLPGPINYQEGKCEEKDPEGHPPRKRRKKRGGSGHRSQVGRAVPGLLPSWGAFQGRDEANKVTSSLPGLWGSCPTWSSSYLD